MEIDFTERPAGIGSSRRDIVVPADVSAVVGSLTSGLWNSRVTALHRRAAAAACQSAFSGLDNLRNKSLPVYPSGLSSSGWPISLLRWETACGACTNGSPAQGTHFRLDVHLGGARNPRTVILSFLSPQDLYLPSASPKPLLAVTLLYDLAGARLIVDEVLFVSETPGRCTSTEFWPRGCLRRFPLLDSQARSHAACRTPSARHLVLGTFEDDLGPGLTRARAITNKT